MIALHKNKHLGEFKSCCNCKSEITSGHILEVNTEQYILCKDCRHKLFYLFSINDNYDHMLLSSKEVY